ncbi:hypothetical protein BCR32DRAFT_294037 [Anaeromyces robustus]|jgi:hypothetical protein|uniref:Uncharacterized protein n=1 Tax=Anaeromyces robustus TaxID=1754192 RepID=A0A1Y1X3V7_9FUNG|nr:hypothetical protein BCR32DRAFT_294037 [Anaeromyces robustus]|eukprot:ORX80056.1 hypothetical protein BCR32DRAFT_294037 [Anaeromyces robustus]
MKFIKLVPVVLALMYGCKAGAIDNGAMNNEILIDNDLGEIDSANIIDIDLDKLNEANDSTPIPPPITPISANNPIIKKKRSLPELTNTTCGDGTKICNVGFGEIKVGIYNLTWYISTPYATVLETFRKKKSDSDEFVSMVGTIRNYNAFLNVYISGTVYNGGCVNDTKNKCNADKYLYEPDNDDGIKFYLKNIEDKSPKYIRFKYSDWLGKCYKIWKLTFDIQATRQDLVDWHWYNKIDIDSYY